MILKYLYRLIHSDIPYYTFSFIKIQFYLSVPAVAHDSPVKSNLEQVTSP
jgi:hypothetical protein